MLKIATKFLPEPPAFRRAFDAGFRSSEIFLNAAVLECVDDVVTMSRGFDMDYALHFPNKPELNESHLKNCCRLADELSVSAVVIHEPMFRRYADSLKAIDSRIPLAIENQRVPSADLSAWVQERGAVTLDIEHIWMFSLPDATLDELFGLVRDVFESASECVRHIHMPGYLPGQGEHRPMYTSREFCMGIFDILADYNFAGLVVSEVDMQFQNEFDLRMDMLLFERWLDLRQ
ncbi:MAG: hypothetical protein P8J37_20425 [Fuerstiella sp.]|jgi:hypothetical protein|nr:hypothetical protein [Fuerstiella sp.]